MRETEVVARVRKQGARLRLGYRKQAEYLLTRGDTVHGHMEEGAELAHGQEEVGRDQDDEETAEEVDRARGGGEERHGHAGHGAAEGHDVHHDDGVELHGEYLHRDHAEVLGLLVHGLVARLVGLVDLEGREALEVLEEGVAQLGVLVPVLAEDALGDLLHEHDDHGDERHAHEQHHGRGQAKRRHHEEEGDGREHGVEELGQVLAKVGLELLAALHGELHDLGRGDELGVVGAKNQQLLVDAAAQHALHVLRGGEALVRGEARGDDAGDDAQGKHAEQWLRQHAARHQSRKRLGDDPHHGDVSEKPHPLREHRKQHMSHRLRDEPQEPFVHHIGVSRSAEI